MIRVSALAIFLTFSLGLFYTAPAEADPTNCADLMKFGIYDTANTFDERQRFHEFRAWLQSYRHSTFNETKSAANQAGIDTTLFSLSYNGTSASQNFHDWVENISSASDDQFFSHSKFAQATVRVSSAITDLVGKCIKAQAQGQQYGWIETSRDRSQLTFHIRYIPNGRGDKAIVTRVGTTPQNYLKKCEQYKKFLAVRSLQTATEGFTCTVNPADTITISVQTTKDLADPRREGQMAAPAAPAAPQMQLTSNFQTQILSSCRQNGILGPLGFTASIKNVPVGASINIIVRKRRGASSGGGFPSLPVSFFIDGHTYPVVQDIVLVNDADLVMQYGKFEWVIAQYQSGNPSVCTFQELHFPNAHFTLTRQP
jgi:hypothetical protein